jgi:hypothetical protein
MEDSGNHGLGLFFGIYGIICCFWLVIYVYASYCLMKIAQKLGVENAWMAWIPVVNIWVMCQAARKEWWWMLLCFVPLINIIAFCVLWMGIAENRGKPSWVGLLILIPLVNFVMMGYLAFTD